MKKMIWSVISSNRVCGFYLWAISQLNRCDLSVGFLNIAFTLCALLFIILPQALHPGNLPLIGAIDYINAGNWINSTYNRLYNRYVRYCFSRPRSR